MREVAAENLKELSLLERIKQEFMVIKSLGVVFGDIGTSPIYTFTVVMLLVKPTMPDIMGVVSLIFWTLMMLVTVQYAWLATSLSKRGEGGTIVLKEILKPMLKAGRQMAFVTLLSFVGISLLIGDGVITPAISILSAVEGVLLIPGYEQTPRMTLILTAVVITIMLFLVQKKGVEKVASAFGPIMLLWFFAIAVPGILSMADHPEIIMALSPTYAVDFLEKHQFASFFMLSDIILCATGGEALYADMGHMGRTPILKGWILVFIALVFCYLGQGAFIITHPESKNILFEMFYSQAAFLYIPFLFLSIIATVIASQAMISGIFSVVYQAITTRAFPHLKVSYTSDEMRSQIYIGFVNWFLCVCVIWMLFEFRESANLASAYGLAVSGAMSITAIMMTMIFYKKRKYLQFFFSIIVALISIIYALSCSLKIPHGGYWSLIIASVPFIMIVIYSEGQRGLYKSFKPIDFRDFLDNFARIRKARPSLEGTALFFARQIDKVPAYIPKTMFYNGIIYERTIIVSVQTTNYPNGMETSLTTLEDGLELFIILAGYMEILDVEGILHQNGIFETTIFYGQEEIITKNPIWLVFSLIKSITPSFVHFYKFPHDKLLGVTRRAEM